MNRLSASTRAQIVSCLVEGNSIRATCRMTGTAKGTVLKLLAEIGEVCQAFQQASIVKSFQRKETLAGCSEPFRPEGDRRF